METALAVLVLLEFPLALQGQRAVFKLDSNLIRINVRKIGLQDQLILGLENVNGRRPGPRCRFTQQPGQRILEQPETGWEVLKLAREGVVFHYWHFLIPPPINWVQHQYKICA